MFLAGLLSPPQTFVLAVVCLEFKNPMFNSIPDGERADRELMSLLKENGVPEKNFVLVEGKRATTARIDFEFREALGRARAEDTLLVYYAGHGFEHPAGFQLATYNTYVGAPGWKMSRAFALINSRFKGRSIALVADCCASGLLQGFASKSRKGVAIFAAALGASEVPEGWGFTKKLTSLLRESKGVLGQAKFNSEFKGHTIHWPDGVNEIRLWSSK
ncbi:MAG: hypothetical protein JNM34_00925 [Chthonomonadaceae bacterium]|jgi:hypothetical protein|nr:hypothetical protein [Chthonomonadaceae bacterium]